MKKKNLDKKLTINKEVVTNLSKADAQKVAGGWTTSIGSCTGYMCCDWNSSNPSACPPKSE